MTCVPRCFLLRRTQHNTTIHPSNNNKTQTDRTVIMATLSQVYINLGIGGVVSTACFLVFGIAVHLEANKNLTPRAWARPVGVIKNCLSPPYSLGWISWAMSLRYIDLLSGIPGTGTRKQGWSGPTLRTNLDGIVLMRYHALQFKVRNTYEYGNAFQCKPETRIRVANNKTQFLFLSHSYSCFLLVWISIFCVALAHRFRFSQRSCACSCCFLCITRRYADRSRAAIMFARITTSTQISNN